MSRNKRHFSKVAQGAASTRSLDNDVQTMTRSSGNQSTTWDKPIPFDGPPGQLFNPGRPIMPTQADEKPRIFQYRSGYNLMYVPRQSAGLIPFPTLRALADSCYQVRFCIELIKREIRALDFKIVPADDKDPNKESPEYAAKIREVEKWFASPDGVLDTDAFINQMLEDILVIDALTLWPEVTMDGDCSTVQQIDGATITPLIDYRGRVPRNEGEPSYLQVLYGIPTSWWDFQSIIYKPMNQSINQVYGKSPIENFILMINIMLRHDQYRLGKFTEGNVPAAFAGLPSTWSQDQIEVWQKYWDALISGNISEQTKVHFLPHDGANLPVYEFNQSSAVDVELDKFLMTVACWAFGISPSEFGITPGQGLGGSGYMAGMQDIQYRSILGPLTQYLESTLTDIIQKYKASYLSFKWHGLEPTDDSLKQAQVDQINLTIGKHDIAFIQDRDGIPVINRPKAPMGQGGFEQNQSGDYVPVPGNSVSYEPTQIINYHAVNPVEYVPTVPALQLAAMPDLIKEIRRANDLLELQKAGSANFTKYELGETPEMQRVEMVFPAPIVNVAAPIVNMPEQPATIVNVAAPIVNMPEQKAPVVNVPAPIVNVAAPVVNIPEQVAPIINVNIPEGKPRDPRKLVITRDRDGKINGMEEEN